MDEPFLKYATLYGGRTNEPVAYCYLHKKHITVNQLRKKECLKKQCCCLKRHEAHPFWEERAQRKEMKRARKTEPAGGDDAIQPEAPPAGS